MRRLGINNHLFFHTNSPQSVKDFFFQAESHFNLHEDKGFLCLRMEKKKSSFPIFANKKTSFKTALVTFSHIALLRAWTNSCYQTYFILNYCCCVSRGQITGRGCGTVFGQPRFSVFLLRITLKSPSPISFGTVGKQAGYLISTVTPITTQGSKHHVRLLIFLLWEDKKAMICICLCLSVCLMHPLWIFILHSNIWERVRFPRRLKTRFSRAHLPFLPVQSCSLGGHCGTLCV